MPRPELDKMRAVGRILGEALSYLTDNFIDIGVTPLDISRKAEELVLAHKGTSLAFKGYRGFPGAVCVSVNQQVVHGVPADAPPIKSGDIVSVDCGVKLDGHFSDACRTVAVGEVNPRTRKLLKVTKEAMDKGIAAALPGNRIGDISFAIQRHVERHKFNVSLELVGHGIGHVLHGPPFVPNYGPPGNGEIIEPGIFLAIEPVVFDGSASAILGQDGWTVYSKHNNLSAHFEETIAITERGPEILTRW